MIFKPKYRCVAFLQIHGSYSDASSSDVVLAFMFRLPFPPQIGITIDASKEGGPSDIVPIEVVWDTTLKVFRVYVEPDRTIYNAIRDGDPRVDMQGRMWHWQGEGWKNYERRYLWTPDYWQESQRNAKKEVYIKHQVMVG
jgi:hypothetical protein